MKNFTAIVISAFLLPLLFCNNPKDNIAGGGDETQTGNRIVGCLVDYRNGRPADSASVRLYHGDTALPASIALDSTITDAGGKYRFDSIAAGTYTIECRKVDGTDTLSAMHRHIRHDTLTVTDVGVDTLKAPGKISGSVDFNSSNKMGVTVFVPGTSFIAITDSSGAFCISYVPPDTYEVAYSYYGYLTAYDTTVVVHANTTTFLPVKHLVRDPGVPPPPPAGLKASYDTLRGIVTISWNNQHDSTVAGYIVFRKDTTKAAQDPTQISGTQLVRDTFYCDTPYNSISDTNPYVFAYYVKAQDKRSNRSLTYSQPVVVAVVYPDLLPSMPQPANGAIDQPILPTLSWHRVKVDSAVYTVFLDTVASPLRLVYQGKNTSVPLSTSLIPGKTYYWQVIASDSADTARGPVWHFTTATLSPPTLASPVNGATGVSDTTMLQWNASGATSYHVQVSTDSSFAGITAEDSMLTIASITISGLSGGSKYYWRARAKNALTTSPWSDVWSFSTMLKTPSLVSPPNGTYGRPLTDTLRWTTVNGASLYHVQVSTSDTFTSILIDDSTLTDTSMIISGLTKDTTYYWRVRSKDGGTISTWSPAFYFSTGYRYHVLFNEGFETDLSQYLQVTYDSAQGMMSISTQHAHSGNGSLTSDSNNTGIKKGISPQIDDSIAGLQFYLMATKAAHTNFIVAICKSGSSANGLYTIMGMGIDKSDSLRYIYENAPGDTINEHKNFAALTLNTWYKCKIEYDYSDTTLTYFLDDATVYTRTTPSPMTLQTFVVMRDSLGAQGPSGYYVDDVTIYKR